MRLLRLAHLVLRQQPLRPLKGRTGGVRCLQIHQRDSLYEEQTDGAYAEAQIGVAKIAQEVREPGLQHHLMPVFPLFSDDRPTDSLCLFLRHDDLPLSSEVSYTRN